jgi:hypothetical protein
VWDDVSMVEMPTSTYIALGIPTASFSTSLGPMVVQIYKSGCQPRVATLVRCNSGATVHTLANSRAPATLTRLGCVDEVIRWRSLNCVGAETHRGRWP